MKMRWLVRKCFAPESFMSRKSSPFKIRRVNIPFSWSCSITWSGSVASNTLYWMENSFSLISWRQTDPNSPCAEEILPPGNLMPLKCEGSVFFQSSGLLDKVCRFSLMVWAVHLKLWKNVTENSNARGLNYFIDINQPTSVWKEIRVNTNLLSLKRWLWKEDSPEWFFLFCPCWFGLKAVNLFQDETLCNQ